VTPALSDRVTQSERNTVWVRSMIDGLTLPFPSANNRQQLAAACWGTVIDHHQAILLLTRAGCYDSARALLRPLFEGYIRGVWLKVGASDHEADVAGQDRFPTFAKMIEAIEDTGTLPGGRFAQLKTAWWGRMCSLCPRGFQRIGTVTTPGDVTGGHDPEEMTEALTWADWTLLQAVRGVGLVAGSAELVRAADEQILGLFGKDASPLASGDRSRSSLIPQDGALGTSHRMPASRELVCCDPVAFAATAASAPASQYSPQRVHRRPTPAPSTS
jgi:hypothetical protein